MHTPPKGPAPQTTYLADYRPPAYLLEKVDLYFQLGEEVTTVLCRTEMRRRNGMEAAAPLVLNGRGLELISLTLDGRAVEKEGYLLDEEFLTLHTLPGIFTLEVQTRIRPGENTQLEGLYRSSGIFCTQCEAEGFRKITYFLDRSDVLAPYTTTIEADKNRYPVLLSNGNLLRTKDLPGDRHEAVWQDPFPKPSYLFALVAGNLTCIEDSFTTRSGRQVLLQIFVEEHNRHQCGHALAALKKAMAWDEEVYGLEYDLNRYMIVAVDDFNMGAMENKGLNIFNSKYVLASQETATDDDFENIEAVIAHEYFHNWTGNRVTCRDWFQLSLKEGLTVFRDQQFTADSISQGVKRIVDVQFLRDVQFSEDRGPMAHPVRPESYIEINNFYTVTIYEKGAEIIRMLHTLLGEKVFLHGVGRYLERHDGTAATTDDFVQALEEVSGRDLSQFRRWYSQAGTPVVEVMTHYDDRLQEYHLTVQQSCLPTPGQSHKDPLHIPLAMGLLGREGGEMPLCLRGEDLDEAPTTRVLEITDSKQVFCFVGVEEEPIPSLLRGFSAPVLLQHQASPQDLHFQFLKDPDFFNRWEAGQTLARHLLLTLIEEYRQGQDMQVDPAFLTTFRAVLSDNGIQDKSYATLLLTLPSEKFLAEAMDRVDVEAIHMARQFLRRALADDLRAAFKAIFCDCSSKEPYDYDPESAGRRRLKNLALSYLMTLGEGEFLERCLTQLRDADNMTDTMGALRPLVHGAFPEKEKALEEFFIRWQDDALVLDKWFTLQATAPLPETLGRVQSLANHPAFSPRNPNRIRALFGAFASGNPVCFHEESGAGYSLIAEQVMELDPVNPQIAARLLGNFSRWRRFDESRQALMKKHLEDIAGKSGLSRDVYEVANKSLA